MIELLSPTDALTRAQAKMRKYLANELRLGWLIDPFGRQVYVYRPGAEPQILVDPDAVEGDPVLARLLPRPDQNLVTPRPITRRLTPRGGAVAGRSARGESESG